MSSAHTFNDYIESDREVYPNPQLQLVAAEVRYPFAPRLGGDEALVFFLDRLGEELPLGEPIREQEVILGTEGADVKGRFAFRLTTRDRMTAVTVAPNRLVLETTAYERYGNFRSLLTRCIAALVEFGVPAGVERVGLRYIDEIRVSDMEVRDASAWAPYIDSSLLSAPSSVNESLPEMHTQNWNGILHFGRDVRINLVVRYGSFYGHAVNPDGPLRLKRARDPGPFFLLDIDCFRASGEVIDEFDSRELIATWDRLHEPISAVFEHCITERLRNDVLRKEN